MTPQKTLRPGGCLLAAHLDGVVEVGEDGVENLNGFVVLDQRAALLTQPEGDTLSPTSVRWEGSLARKPSDEVAATVSQHSRHLRGLPLSSPSREKYLAPSPLSSPAVVCTRHGCGLSRLSPSAQWCPLLVLCSSC